MFASSEKPKREENTVVVRELAAKEGLITLGDFESLWEKRDTPHELNFEI